jgi:hypothetical protein
VNAILDLRLLAQEAEQLDALCGGDERLFHDMLLGETDIDRIVMRIHEQVARDEEMLAGIKERKAALAERQSRIETRRDNGKAFIGKALRIARLSKLELPEVTYSVRDGKAALKVVDAEAVPTEFCRVKSEPDKTLINSSFADSDALPNWLVREAPRDVVTARTK